MGGPRDAISSPINGAYWKESVSPDAPGPHDRKRVLLVCGGQEGKLCGECLVTPVLRLVLLSSQPPRTNKPEPTRPQS
jgi:hypothetical protein